MSLNRAKICPVCGAGNDSRLEVCRNCGASLAEVEAPREALSAYRGMVRWLRISAAITFAVFFLVGIFTINGYTLLIPLLFWVMGLAMAMLQLGLAEALVLLRELREDAAQ